MEQRAVSLNRIATSSTAWAMVGGLLVWLAFPPVGFAPLVWLGIAIWSGLCLLPQRFSRRDYLGIYFAGFVHWMLVTHWVRLPHWSAYFGWFALSAYLAVYLPLFVALVREALARRVPLALAAPIVWCGLELIRAHALTGFAIAILGHTQVRIPVMIQISDLCGAYGVSFVIVLVGSAVAQSLTGPLQRWTDSGMQHDKPRALANAFVVLLAGSVLIATIGYGRRRLAEPPVEQTDSIRAALIQGAIDTKFDGVDNTNETLQQYVSLSQAAIANDGPVDLVVWPESMYAIPWVTIKGNGALHVPDELQQAATNFRKNIRDWELATQRHARLIAQAIGTPMLAGASRLVYSAEPMRRYNSALYLDADGSWITSYEKMHPVLFGEYVPLGKLFPWLYRLTPMGSGLEAGAAPKCVQVGGVCISPSICFENTVPHLLRRQYLSLREQGNEPDALVTITNDGWFWGSSLLDLHLTCGVFRAIELRRPLLIAANTGFSAEIDARGRILQRGPRRATGSLVATVTARDPSESVYLACGDRPVGVCAAICGLLALAGCGRGRSPKSAV